jgi:hypothetical protein
LSLTTIFGLPRWSRSPACDGRGGAPLVLWFRRNDVGTRIFIARCAAGGTTYGKEAN